MRAVAQRRACPFTVLHRSLIRISLLSTSCYITMTRMTTSTESRPTPALRHKPYGGLQMEGPLARWYARDTRARRDHRTDAQAIAAQLDAGRAAQSGDVPAPVPAVLEVATGPGYTAIELARLGDHAITGLDISHSFVRIAAANAADAGVHIDFRQGDVARMPFPDPVAALDAIHRVLRTGGRLSIFDLRKDAPREAIDREIRDMHVSPPNAF